MLHDRQLDDDLNRRLRVVPTALEHWVEPFNDEKPCPALRMLTRSRPPEQAAQPTFQPFGSSSPFCRS
jgi:hypothetical protein